MKNNSIAISKYDDMIYDYIDMEIDIVLAIVEKKE